MTFAPLAALAVSLACAQQEGEVRRGPIDVRIQVNGTVVAEDVFRLKSSIEGRVEAVLASSYTWAGPDAPLALIADNTLAALIDNRQTTPMEVLQERWQREMRPSQVRCLDDCFVLAAFARPKRKVLPQAVLFEAATTLRLVGRVRPNDRGWIKEGQTIEYWPEADPSYRQKARVAKFVVDIPGSKGDSPGTLTARLDRQQYLVPGTPWSGFVLVERKKAVLRVPTGALIRFKDGVYLPVKVSTGATTDDLTEITAGIEDRRPVLILKPSDLGAATPHATEPAPQPPPQPRATFDPTLPNGNRALDDSPYDKPAGDDDE